jgi:uncharacterized membrane protein YfcA
LSIPPAISQYLVVSLILFLSSVVQGAVGFAAGLFGIPLLMLTGISLPDAVAISIVASAVQNLVAAWQLRREIDFRLALRPTLIRLATLPIGVWALWELGSESNDLASQAVGVTVLAIVAVQTAFRAQPQEKLHGAWEWLAFSLGGFLLGFCGMGGPPMVLWVMAHNWPMNRARALLYFLFVTGMPPQAFIMWLMFGNKILGAMLLGLAALPALLAGLYLGLWFSRLMSDRVLRRLSWVMLVLIALSAIVMPYVT